MRIDDFLWLPAVVERLAWKHRLSEAEVEDVFFDAPRYRFVETGRVEGEDLYAALGRTDAGRYVVVFFIAKADGIAMIVSARDMDSRERRQYGRK